jgi:ATP-dependent helicase HepA
MEALKIGMYVRCPFDNEDQENPRVFILGQITEVNNLLEVVKVKFHDIENIHTFYDIPEELVFDIGKVDRCKVLKNSKAILGTGKECKVICRKIVDTEGNDYFKYYVQYLQGNENMTEIMSEKDLKVQFTRADSDPRLQMRNFEFQNPKWYNHRKTVMNSLHVLKNATFGFETLVGSRVFLLPHQVDTIIRAIGSDNCRFMLADEVGLGKTIEACVIMKGLKERIGKLRTLIIAPDSLVHQWQNELSVKFWTDIPIWSGNNFDEGTDLILPLEKIASAEGQAVLREKWDLCIIDETHRLTGMDKEYAVINDLAKIIKHILLLSATPIQQRRQEYLKLLRLLEPRRYSNMDNNEFSDLLDKQKMLRNRVHPMVRDIEDYIEDELFYDYHEDLNEIVDRLKDRVLEKLVKAIDIDSEDKGLENVKLALAYIGEHYQIERKIIRHRRLELKDKMAKRDLIKIDYELVGGERDFYESDAYDALMEYLEKVLLLEDSIVLKGEYVRVFISAMFSSPWALKEVLGIRRQALNIGKVLACSEEQIKFNSSPRHERTRIKQIITSVSTIDAETQRIEKLITTCSLWERAANDELNNLEELYDYPEKIKGRLVKIIDYISEAEEEKKYVLFTSWKETLIQLEKALKRRFGEETTVSFYSDMDEELLQKSVDKFQGDKNCRFMICDELGGEGRNFQIADTIIHVDLPWSPVQLEQRIGRLDRIGRDNHRSVLSLVCCSIETVEEDLFNLWDQGLNIFKESLSGLEIALGGIHDQIVESLGKDIRYGLSQSIEEIKNYSLSMKKIVEEERYFDMSRQLDASIEEQLTKLIQKFDENEGQSLYNTMMSWTTMAGLGASIIDFEDKIVSFAPSNFSANAMRNTIFVPPNLEEARRRSKKINTRDIRGSFSRKTAINREDLIFYAPGDPFFDSIVNNAEELSRGRSCAYAQKSSVDWEGFVLTWSINIDPRYILDIGEGLENLAMAQGYIPLEQITNYVPISEEYNDVDINIVKYEILNGFNISQACHYGRRKGKDDFMNIRSQFGLSNLEWFKRQFTYSTWGNIVNKVYKQGRESAIKMLMETVDIKRLRDDLAKNINGIKSSNLYYNNESLVYNEESKRLLNIYNALLKGVGKPELLLDSIAYIRLVKVNE